MNVSQKCNCCIKEDVCKFKTDYERAIQAILDCNVANNDKVTDGCYAILELKNAKFIEVSIKCPHMATQSTVRAAEITSN